MLRQYPKQKSKENQLAFFAALFTQVKLAGQLRLKQNRRKIIFPQRLHSLGLILSHLVILSKHVLLDLRLTLTAIKCIIRSGTLLYGVPTQNSTLLRLVVLFGVELYYTEYLLGIAPYSDQYLEQEFYSGWCRRLRLEKTMCLKSVGERSQKCDRGNREQWWCQIKSIYRWYLDLVVKRLHCINYLNAWVNSCATFSNQMLCCGTFLLHKNDETKNTSGLQFKTQH